MIAYLADRLQRAVGIKPWSEQSWAIVHTAYQDRHKPGRISDRDTRMLL